jgi:predicted secreted protein
MSWVWANPGATVMMREGPPVYASKQGAGTETWRFRASRPGYQTVRLEYRRKWAQSMPERTFRFTATVR